MGKTKKDNEELLQIKTNEINVDSLKDELKDFITLEIRKEFNTEVEKTNKRLIKEKNKRLIFKNIIILFLIVLIGFLLYLMYNDGYFKRLFNKNSEIIDTSNISKDKENKNDVPDEKELEKEKKKTQEELKREYSYLLDDIYINENSIYLEDYYNGELSNELKNYLALNLIDFRSLIKEEDYNIIDDDTLKIKYNKLFNDEYISTNFNYNGNEIRYINRIGSYISDKILENSNSNIVKEITNINKDENEVIIETIEYLSKDNKIYNILTKEEIEGNISDNFDKLTNVKYTFSNLSLTKIERKK